jgi:fructokinase
MFGAIEAGGTKFVCAIGDQNGNIIKKVKFPTKTPKEVIPKIGSFFKDYNLQKIGVGSFGPIGVNIEQDNYGYILNTPKKGWKEFNFLYELKENLQAPISWTTDVNIALYGEMKHGAGQGLKNLVYLTVGTGIGAGVVNHSKFYYGTSHTEVGHTLLTKLPDDSDFKGTCPYHYDKCAEGLAAGPALQQRVNGKATQLEKKSKIWDLEAEYLAQLCHNVTLSYAPQRIILGGGVMHNEQLFPKIKRILKKYLNGYYEIKDYDNYIVPAELGDDAGIIGGICLAANNNS